MDMMDKINEISLAALHGKGVQLHSDHLWDQVHNVTMAHSPDKHVRPDNKFASLGFVHELMVDEVHTELVETGMIQSHSLTALPNER
jgi:hypothetical protein